MTRLKLLGACAALVAAASFAAPAQAAPGAALKPLSPIVDSNVVKVHGCHSDWRRGRNGRWHRHRRDCSRVSARRYRDRPRDWRRRGCINIGPVWVCE